MRFGFSFNGIHSSKFGIAMLTKSRTLLPEAKIYSYGAPAFDGSYDFTEANSRGRAAYTNRTFQLTMQVGADNLLHLQEKINGICSWLVGKGELIFDDIPDSIWTVRLINAVDFAPESSGCRAVLNAVFEAEPFARGQFDTLSGPVLDNTLRLESKLRLELSDDFSLTLERGRTSYEFEIINFGTWYVNPTVIIETKFKKVSDISIACGGRVIALSGELPDKIVIDTDKCTIEDGSGASLIKYTNGDFFELMPGKNAVTLSGNRTFKSDISVNVIYTPRFLYTADFEHTEEV